MKVGATAAECYRRRHRIADTAGCLFTAIKKSIGAMGGADEVQSDRRGEAGGDP